MTTNIIKKFWCGNYLSNQLSSVGNFQLLDVGDEPSITCDNTFGAVVVPGLIVWEICVSVNYTRDTGEM